METALVGLGSDFSESEGMATMELLLSHCRPDSVVTTDDYIAFGVLEALSRAKISDVPVVGFNNTLRGRYQSPTLTSVDVRPADLGSHAASLLIDAIVGVEDRLDHRIINTVLIERETTTALPQRQS